MRDELPIVASNVRPTCVGQGVSLRPLEKKLPRRCAGATSPSPSTWVGFPVFAVGCDGEDSLAWEGGTTEIRFRNRRNPFGGNSPSTKAHFETREGVRHLERGKKMEGKQKRPRLQGGKKHEVELDGMQTTFAQRWAVGEIPATTFPEEEIAPNVVKQII